MAIKDTSGTAFARWTFEFPRCTQRAPFHGQCIHNHRHHGCCKAPNGFKWWPEPRARLEPLPIAEFARFHGIVWDGARAAA